MSVSERRQRQMTMIARIGAVSALAMAGIVAYRLIWAWGHLSPSAQAAEKTGFGIVWLTVGVASLGSLQLLRLGPVSSLPVLAIRMVLAALAILVLWRFDVSLRNIFLAGQAQ